VGGVYRQQAQESSRQAAPASAPTQGWLLDRRPACGRGVQAAGARQPRHQHPPRDACGSGIQEAAGQQPLQQHPPSPLVASGVQSGASGSMAAAQLQRQNTRPAALAGPVIKACRAACQAVALLADAMVQQPGPCMLGSAAVQQPTLRPREG
jgi:hypothetical protein